MAKRAKSSNSYVELPGDDRISNLPDGIRCHILSFLPTKDAVATTVLSKKWMNLWTTVLSDIEFDDNCFPFISRRRCLYSDDFVNWLTDEEWQSCCIKFAGVVNKVLLFHNLPVMKRFSLQCVQDSDVYDVCSWVSKVIDKKIEELYVCVESIYENEEPTQLPISVFSCETLKVLKLEGSIIVRMLTSCSLPRLETLELSYICYENDESAQKLISSCSSLESLDISREMKDGVANFIIRSDTLKNLKIDQTHCSESDSCNFVINAPGLQHLKLVNGSVNGFFIENLSSLEETDLTFSEYLDNGSFLQGICNSKIINISGGMFQSAIPARPFPNFDRLSSLTVTTSCCDWDSLQEFIKNSNRLESLVFFKMIYCRKPNRKHVVCWRNPETVPNCLLSSLKTMTFINLFSQKDDEVDMVEYVLKNAKVLQKMDISLLQFYPREIEARLREKLLKIPTGSEECQVNID